jgi:hypothetical protein
LTLLATGQTRPNKNATSLKLEHTTVTKNLLKASNFGTKNLNQNEKPTFLKKLDSITIKPIIIKDSASNCPEKNCLTQKAN